MKAFMVRLLKQDDPDAQKPVADDNIATVGVEGSDVLVSFRSSYAIMHGYWGVAYHASSVEEAEEVRDRLLANPKAYFWTYIRPPKMGPAYFTGRMTRGGTSASGMPYDYVDPSNQGGDFMIEYRLKPDGGAIVKGHPWYSRLQDLRMNGAADVAAFVMKMQGVISRAFLDFLPQGRQIIIDRINRAIRNAR